MKPLSAACLSLLLVFQSPGIANANEPLHLSLATLSAQITPGVEGQDLASIDVFVSGDKPALVSIAVIDLILEESGKSPVEAGSTPYTLKDQLTFEPRSFQYRPNGAKQRFRFAITAKNKNLNEVRYGGLQTSLTLNNSSKSSLSSQLAAITTFAIVPAGLSLDLKANKLKPVSSSKLELLQSHKASLADWIFPDIPGVVNSAPVKLRFKLNNPNELPAFTTQRLTWKSNNQVKNITNRTPRLLFGGQSSAVSEESIVNVQGESVVTRNYAKPFETLKVKVEFYTFLGNQSLKPVTREGSVLVFPWKELLFWALVLSVVAWSLIRWRRRLDKNIDPNIAWLFVVWVFKSAVRKLKAARSK